MDEARSRGEQHRKVARAFGTQGMSALPMRPTFLAALFVLVSATGHAAETLIGTAVSLNSRGELLTNRHVIEGCKTLAIRTFRDQVFRARLIAASNKYDLAVILAEGYTPEKSVWLAVGKNRFVYIPTAGMRLLYGGFDNDPTLVDIANGEALATAADAFISQMRSGATHGASGSGVFDQTGSLLGIVFSGHHKAYQDNPTGPPSLYGENLVNFYNNNALVDFLQTEVSISISYMRDAPVVPRSWIMDHIFAATTLVVCER
jgi:hypothetical protein